MAKPDEKAAQKRVDEAQEQLAEAQQELQSAHAAGGLAHLTVKVRPGNTVWQAGESHGEGSEFPVEALTAVGLAQQGHVTITGTHEGQLPHESGDEKADAKAAAERSRKAEVAQLRARIKELEGAK